MGWTYESSQQSAQIDGSGQELRDICMSDQEIEVWYWAISQIAHLSSL